MQQQYFAIYAWICTFFKQKATVAQKWKMKGVSSNTDKTTKISINANAIQTFDAVKYHNHKNETVSNRPGD